MRTGQDRTKPAASLPAYPRGCPSRPLRPGSQAGERPEAGRAEGPGPGLVGCRPRSPSLSCHRRPQASAGHAASRVFQKAPRADPEEWGLRPRGSGRPISKDPGSRPRPCASRASRCVAWSCSGQTLHRFQASPCSPCHGQVGSFLSLWKSKSQGSASSPTPLPSPPHVAVCHHPSWLPSPHRAPRDCLS